MLDIQFIRDNPDIVKAAIQNKKTEPVDVAELIALADSRKALGQELDALNRARNDAQKNRDIETGKRLKDEAAALEAKYAAVEKSYVALMLKLPNIPSPDTPVGMSDDANKVLREVGEKPHFGFSPKPHWELGEALGLIDQETAGEVSGARFTYIKGDLALMQFALLSLSMSILTNEETLADIARRAGLTVSTKPFVPVIPPYMMKSAVMNRMARLQPLDERYFFEKDDIVLVGSAEHTLGPMHMDESIPEAELPIRYVGYSPAFRREAGTYGKDTRGLIRLHHFDKIEMETFVRPQDGYTEQDFIVAIQEHFLQLLGLPYQVVLKCTGDQGTPDHRALDMETWMPGQNAYRETHTSDYMGGYQSRRLNTRVKHASGESEVLHMNDATLVAMGRMLAAILENYQQADGTVRVPRALRPFLGKDVIGA
ncbi:serine--tRNA ligase [Patescibacteria group bacterium]|nr:serine--tRNA ligase [Patescibacteria group bacterium]